MATVFETVRTIIAEQLGVDEDEIKEETSFVEDLNADSLDLVELIMSLDGVMLLREGMRVRKYEQ